MALKNKTRRKIEIRTIQKIFFLKKKFPKTYVLVVGGSLIITLRDIIFDGSVSTITLFKSAINLCFGREKESE